MTEPERRELFWDAELRRFLPHPAEALAKGFEYVCCPICCVLADLPFEYFRLLPPRWREEPAMREVVRRARGFCNHHTWRLHEVLASVSVAAIYSELLAGAWDDEDVPEACPLCRLQQLAAEALIIALTERLADPDRLEEYRHCFGLCYPHFRQVLAADLSDDVRSAIVGAQQRRTEALIAFLRGHVSKSEPPAKWSRTPEEVRSPRWALLKAAGNEDL